MTEEVNYIEIATGVGKLVTKKQKMYGNSFGFSPGIIKILYPNGISVDQYENFLIVIRIIDKLFRIANGDTGGESAFSDICGYSLLALGNQEQEEKHSCQESGIVTNNIENKAILGIDYEYIIKRVRREIVDEIKASMHKTMRPVVTEKGSLL
jgi:hypothetical protein